MIVVDTFLQADRAVEAAIAGVPDDRWPATVPPVFATDPIGQGSVRAAVAHLAYDEGWIPALLAGRTMDEVGRDAVDGDAVLGDDPAAGFARLAVEARAAAARADDLAATVHCSFGDCSVEEYLWQLVVARTLGADALALAAGTPSTVGEELAAAVLVGLAPRAALWRAVGVLRPEQETTSPAATDRLRALAGTGAVPA